MGTSTWQVTPTAASVSSPGVSLEVDPPGLAGLQVTTAQAHLDGEAVRPEPPCQAAIRVLDGNCEMEHSCCISGSFVTQQ